MPIANTTIVLKKSGATGNTPVSLANGEIAINYADGKLFYRTPSGTISTISSGSITQSFATINANSSLILATSNTDTLSFSASNGISITANTISKTITIGNGTTVAIANAAYTMANSANVLAQNAYNWANTVNVFTQSAYTMANSANVLAQAAFNQANTANGIANVALANTGTTITVNGSSILVIANTKASTSNTTGALTVAGGVGISGNLYAGTIYSSNTVYAPAFQANNGLILNANTISSNITVPTGVNAISVGPMTIANGVSVTISTGNRWIIL